MGASPFRIKRHRAKKEKAESHASRNEERFTLNIRSASRSPILDHESFLRLPPDFHVSFAFSSPRRTSPELRYCRCESPRDRSRKCRVSS